MVSCSWVGMFGVEASEAGSVVLPRGGATNNASEMRSIDLYRPVSESRSEQSAGIRSKAERHR